MGEEGEVGLDGAHNLASGRLPRRRKKSLAPGWIGRPCSDARFAAGAALDERTAASDNPRRYAHGGRLTALPMG